MHVCGGFLKHVISKKVGQGLENAQQKIKFIGDMSFRVLVKVGRGKQAPSDVTQRYHFALEACESGNHLRKTGVF